MLKRIFLNEKGSAFLMVFFCAIVLSVLGVTALYLANTELTESSKKYEMAKAFYLAEAGLQRAFSEMNSGTENGWDDELAGSDGEMGTDDDGILSFGPRVDCYKDHYGDEKIDGGSVENERQDLPYYLGYYNVRIGDGRHPDDRNEVCKKVILRSTGVSTQDFTKILEAEIKIFDLPTPPAVVFLVPKADAGFPDPDFNGQSWMIDGNDRTPDGSPDGTPGTGNPILGVASNNSVVPLIGALKDNQRDQVQGVGYDDEMDPPTPSIQQIGLEVNMYETVEYLRRISDNTVAPGTYAQFDGQFGTSDDYQVTMCDGDLHLSGQVGGCGVLVVNGHLTISGQGFWHGYIFCTEGATITGGGLPFHLYGAMIVGTTPMLDKHANFTISGQADLYYSQQTCAQARTDLHTAYFSYWSDM